jgi:hypothetical protein
MKAFQVVRVTVAQPRNLMLRVVAGHSGPAGREPGAPGPPDSSGLPRLTSHVGFRRAQVGEMCLRSAGQVALGFRDKQLAEGWGKTTARQRQVQIDLEGRVHNQVAAEGVVCVGVTCTTAM